MQNPLNYVLNVTAFVPGSVSPFAFFHFTFLGYDFRDTTTGKIYTKTEFYFLDPLRAYSAARSLNVPKPFILQRRPAQTIQNNY